MWDLDRKFLLFEKRFRKSVVSSSNGDTNHGVSTEVLLSFLCTAYGTRVVGSLDLKTILGNLSRCATAPSSIPNGHRVKPLIPVHCWDNSRVDVLSNSVAHDFSLRVVSKTVYTKYIRMRLASVWCYRPSKDTVQMPRANPNPSWYVSAL